MATNFKSQLEYCPANMQMIQVDSHPIPGRPPRLVGVGCIELNRFPTFLSPWESDRGPIRFDATKLLPFTEVAISRRGGGKIWMKPLTLRSVSFRSACSYVSWKCQWRLWARIAVCAYPSLKVTVFLPNGVEEREEGRRMGGQ